MTAAKTSTVLNAGWTTTTLANAVRDLFVAAGFTSNLRDTINTRLTSRPATAITWERSRVRIVPEAGLHGDLGLTFYFGIDTTSNQLNTFVNLSTNNHGTFLYPENLLHNATNTWGLPHWMMGGTHLFNPPTTSAIRITLYRDNTSPCMYYFFNITTFADTSARNDFQLVLLGMTNRGTILTSSPGLDVMSPWITLRNTMSVPGSTATSWGATIGGKMSYLTTGTNPIKHGHNTTLGLGSVGPAWAGLAGWDSSATDQNAIAHNHMALSSEPDLFGRLVVRKGLFFRCSPSGANTVSPLVGVDPLLPFGWAHPDIVVGPGVGPEGYRLVVQTGVEEYEQTHARPNNDPSVARGMGPQFFVRVI